MKCKIKAFKCVYDKGVKGIKNVNLVVEASDNLIREEEDSFTILLNEWDVDICEAIKKETGKEPTGFDWFRFEEVYCEKHYHLITETFSKLHDFSIEPDFLDKTKYDIAVLIENLGVVELKNVTREIELKENYTPYLFCQTVFKYLKEYVPEFDIVLEGENQNTKVYINYSGDVVCKQELSDDETRVFYFRKVAHSRFNKILDRTDMSYLDKFRKNTRAPFKTINEKKGGIR